MAPRDASTAQGEPRPVHRPQHVHELRELSTCCSELGQLFRDHGEQWYAAAYDSLGERALHLSDQDFEQSDLNSFSEGFPTPEWLEPKSLDYNAPRSSWQERAAELHARARTVALDLRTIATYDGQ
jgi:hypothetical protein